MKQLYFVLFLFCCSFGFAQELKTDGDIDGLKLYPNPVTQGKVVITTASNAPKEVVIFDVLGTQVLRTNLRDKELDLSQLSRGVYILRVVENNKIATRKLILK